VIVDDRCARDILVLVVMWSRNTTARLGTCCRIVDVANQHWIMEEWYVYWMSQVIHVKALVALYKAMVVMEYVPTAIVEHASATAEGRKRSEVVEYRGSCRWLQMPAEATSMSCVVEESKVSGTSTHPRHPNSPAPVSVCYHVIAMPSHKAWQPKAGRLQVIVEQQVVLEWMHCEIVLKQGIVLIAALCEEAVAMCLVSHIMLNSRIIRGMNDYCALESIVVGVVAQICLVHDIDITSSSKDMPMR